MTQKGLFPYHLQETVKVFPALIAWGSHKELDSAVEKWIESKTVGYLNFSFCKQIHNFEIKQFSSFSFILQGQVCSLSIQFVGQELAVLVWCFVRANILWCSCLQNRPKYTLEFGSAKLHKNSQIWSYFAISHCFHKIIIHIFEAIAQFHINLQTYFMFAIIQQFGNH